MQILNHLHIFSVTSNMRCYLFAVFLLIFITNYVYSSQSHRTKRCLMCCGKPPCCNCCGLPGCGPKFNFTGIDFSTEPIVEKTTVPELNNATRPTLCLTCCGKPPCCNTCGLDIKLS